MRKFQSVIAGAVLLTGAWVFAGVVAVTGFSADPDPARAGKTGDSP